MTKTNGAAQGTGPKVLLMCAVDFTVRQFLLPLAGALRDAGYRVTIACSRGPMFDGIAAEGFDIRENPVSRTANVASHAASLRRTVRLMRAERFDVVHVHTPIAALIGRAAARLARIPTVIYTAHGFYFHEGMPRWKQGFHVGLERFGAAMGDFLMTVSREDMEAALRLGIARPGRVETIYNGVDLARFDPARFSAHDRAATRASVGIPPDVPVIGIVGRMVREKGFFELFDAAAEIRRLHPDVRFLVVGDVLPSDRGAGRSEIIERVKALGLDDCFAWAGMVPDTAPWLAAMDVFTLPSYREGMPVSLLEAMATALPAVATNIRGCREEVVDGQTGWLVPVRDPHALGDRILHLLANPSEACEMGRKGRARVAEMFDIRKVLAHQLEIYGRLTGGNAERGMRNEE